MRMDADGKSPHELNPGSVSASSFRSLDRVPTTSVGSRDFSRGEGVTAARFALILAAGIFAAYPDVLLGMRTFFFRDFGYFGYPLAFHHRESFWHGEIPLWNPLNNFGLPFLAQWNTLRSEEHTSELQSRG